MNDWHAPPQTILTLLLFINVHLIVIHLIPLNFITSIIITSIFLLFLYQLEEHVTYLVCEVELNNRKKNWKLNKGPARGHGGYTWGNQLTPPPPPPHLFGSGLPLWIRPTTFNMYDFR